ncbi:MAG TPA: heme-binding domain-containing protein [Draconibacterium sp.]|nr:heme-binding domain-containing protein [Draconibacterium sp.]
MLNKRFIPSTLLVFLFATIIATASENQVKSKAIDIPDNVKTIIDKSCFGCHNTDSKNDKAKDKLDLKTLGDLETAKMIHALKEINEVVEKNEMPPEKFLERFPDKKLTDDEKKILMNWADAQAKSLMK